MTLDYKYAGLKNGDKIGKATVVIDIVQKGNPEVRPGTAMKPEYQTIHNTGNNGRGANAKAHNTYLHNQSKLPVKDTTHVSWHTTIDEDYIYIHIPFDETAWHCGDGANGTGNKKSIGHEICMHVDQKNYDQAEENAVALAAHIANYYSMKVENTVPHKKWSGKNCPQIILARDGSLDKFVGRVTKKIGLINEAPTLSISKPVETPKGLTAAEIEQLAKEVINGRYGNGEARKKALGANYKVVQDRVDAIQKAKKAAPKVKTTAELVAEVLAGKHGSGRERMISLGTRYAEVQAAVNKAIKNKK